MQYSCLGNPMDRGARRATARGVAKSLTRLKQLGMHGNINRCNPIKKTIQEFPLKFSIRLGLRLSHCTPRYLSEKKACVHTYTRKFIPGLCVTDKNWRQPECPSTGERYMDWDTFIPWTQWSTAIRVDYCCTI